LKSEEKTQLIEDFVG